MPFGPHLICIRPAEGERAAYLPAARPPLAARRHLASILHRLRARVDKYEEYELVHRAREAPGWIYETDSC